MVCYFLLLVGLTVAVAQPAKVFQSADVVSWGASVAGPVPAGMTNVTALAGGTTHSLALKSDGAVVLWGTNVAAPALFAAGLSNIAAIAAGPSHSLALGSNGVVFAWGSNAAGQTNVPVSASNVVAIAAGQNHSLAVRSNGTVVAWGTNLLGTNATGQLNVPASATNVVAVAVGALHDLALRSNGTVVAWGANGSGQTNVPGGLSNVVAVVAGDANSFALKNDGTVVGWGAPSLVTTGLSNVTAIAVGGVHFMALKSNGTVVSLGANQNGRTDVADKLTNVVAIAEGHDHSLAIQHMTLAILIYQPTNSVVAEILDKIPLAVTGIGGPPLTYQWQFNGTNIAGATNQSYLIDGVRNKDVGGYRVIISNSYGSVTSVVTQVSIPVVFGSFRGLFYETNGVYFHSAGFISVNLSKIRAFSGKLYVDGDELPFTGTFAGGPSQFKIISRARQGKPDLILDLQHFQTNTIITGSVRAVTNGNQVAWLAPLEAELGRMTGSNDVDDVQGKYTFTIPGFENPASGPPGSGYVQTTINSHGLVIWSGFAADGKQVSGGGLSRYAGGEGEWPLFARMHPVNQLTTNSVFPTSVTTIKSYRAALMGWVSQSGTNHAPVATLIWIKRPVAGSLYPAGFTNKVAIRGSAYVPPATGSRPVAITNGVMIASFGDLTTPITNTFTLTPNGIFEFSGPNTNLFNLYVFRNSGAFRGSFSHGNSDHPLRGGLLQGFKQGEGYFLGTNRGGSILIK